MLTSIFLFVCFLIGIWLILFSINKEEKDDTTFWVFVFGAVVVAVTGAQLLEVLQKLDGLLK